MANEPGLSQEELDNQDAQELEERDEMSLVNLNLAVPVNAGVAANVLSDGATSYADAAQNNTLPQSNL
jgi:phospholipase C